VGIYNLTSGRTRQLTLEESFSLFGTDSDKKLEEALREMGERYGMDFSANPEHVYRLDSLHRLVEEMRVRRVYG